jgi:glutaredoxin
MYKLLLVLLLNFTTLKASELCQIEENSLCNVEGGKFTKEEINILNQKETNGIQNIYKEIENGTVHIYMFYTYDCPHCKKAHKFLEELSKNYPETKIHFFETKKNKQNLEVFDFFAKEYNVKPQGVPTIFIGEQVFVGFNKDITCEAVIKELNKLKGMNCASTEISIPLIGSVNIGSISLPALTMYLGILDGVNPCAMWVLVFLLGLMVSTKNRKKMILIGSTFVIASGLIYFLFMTAWVNIFFIIGYSNTITIILASIAIIMGLINLKELFFFKKGISLMIPDSVKPKLYKKARAIIFEKEGFIALISTLMLAVFVNFIELACTVGLPAIYTRILTLRNVSILNTYFYIALYNIMYIIPLAIIVVLFVYTMGKFKFTEKHGKILKLISGTIMLILGILLITNPELLILG